jgi:hypothetical protein
MILWGENSTWCHRSRTLPGGDLVKLPLSPPTRCISATCSQRLLSVDSLRVCQRNEGDSASSGLESSLYSGHSFRIGAAAAAQVPAQGICRWSSDAYLCYICSSVESLAEVSHLIAFQSMVGTLYSHLSNHLLFVIIIRITFN